MTGPRIRRRAGFTVIEFVVAMSLTLGVLVATGLGVGNAQKVFAENRARDAATGVASSLLEQFRVMGCGSQLGPGDSSSTAINARCAAITAAGITGDGTFTLPDPSNADRTLTVSLQTRWRQTATPTTQCLNPAPSGPTEQTQPTLLERTVVVTYPTPSGTKSTQLTTTEAVTSGGRFTTNATGSLLVYAPKGAVVTLGSGQSAVSRTALSCGANAAAWFPYLPTGRSYSITSSSGATASVQLNDVSALEVRIA